MQNIEWTGCLVSTLREYGGVCGLSILIANASENYLSSSEDLHKVWGPYRVYFHCKNILKNKVYDKHFLILKFLSDILLRTFFILLFTHKLLGFVNILMSAPCSHLSLGVIRCSFPL